MTRADREPAVLPERTADRALPHSRHPKRRLQSVPRAPAWPVRQMIVLSIHSRKLHAVCYTTRLWICGALFDALQKSGAASAVERDGVWHRAGARANARSGAVLVDTSHTVHSTHVAVCLQCSDRWAVLCCRIMKALLFIRCRCSCGGSCSAAWFRSWRPSTSRECTNSYRW